MHNITLINGDGIGPEVIDSAVRIIDKFKLPIVWETFEAGREYFENTGLLLQDGLLDNIRINKIVLKGPTETPVAGGFRSINVLLRKEFETYANVRPVKSMSGIKSNYENLDIVVIRENTEDLYAGIEYMASDNMAQSIKIITREASEKICTYAFEYAKSNNRNNVTVVHKANIMKLTDGLFLETFRKISKLYPEISPDEKIVDNMCMQLVMNPNQFDVIVAPNLYGDIISDLCSGLTGGLGLASSSNIGDDIKIYEAVHGSAPDIAGLDISNPTAVILSSAMMLSDLGYRKESEIIVNAVLKTLADKKYHTQDLGGTADRLKFTDAVISSL